MGANSGTFPPKGKLNRSGMRASVCTRIYVMVHMSATYLHFRYLKPEGFGGNLVKSSQQRLHGNKCLHFIMSSIYLMYYIYSYLYACSVLHFIMNKSIKS